MCCVEESGVGGLCCVVILQDVDKRMQKYCKGLCRLKWQLCFPVLFGCFGDREVNAGKFCLNSEVLGRMCFPILFPCSGHRGVNAEKLKAPCCCNLTCYQENAERFLRPASPQVAVVLPGSVLLL